MAWTARFSALADTLLPSLSARCVPFAFCLAALVDREAFIAFTRRGAFVILCMISSLFSSLKEQQEVALTYHPPVEELHASPQAQDEATAQRQQYPANRQRLG
jgi:hypothetical protein